MLSKTRLHHATVTVWVGCGIQLLVGIIGLLLWSFEVMPRGYSSRLLEFLPFWSVGFFSIVALQLKRLDKPIVLGQRRGLHVWRVLIVTIVASLMQIFLPELILRMLLPPPPAFPMNQMPLPVAYKAFAWFIMFILGLSFVGQLAWCRLLYLIDALPDPKVTVSHGQIRVVAVLSLLAGLMPFAQLLTMGVAVVALQSLHADRQLATTAIALSLLRSFAVAVSVVPLCWLALKVLQDSFNEEG